MVIVRPLLGEYCAGSMNVTQAMDRSDMSTSPQNEPQATASARIAVNVWQPEPYDESEAGPTLVRIHVEEAFDGDISGTGVATFLQTLRSDGSASFCALERVTGSIAGRSGSFVLQDTGSLDPNGGVSGTWFVVPGSGTGELANLCGEGRFAASLGEHADAELRYWFE